MPIPALAAWLRRAAGALGKAWQMERPKAEVVVRDVLDFTPGVFRRTYAEGYLQVVRTAPELWGYLYAEANRKSAEPWRRAASARR